MHKTDASSNLTRLVCVFVVYSIHVRLVNITITQHSSVSPLTYAKHEQQPTECRHSLTNSLPPQTRATSSLLTFRQETKSHLFRQSFGRADIWRRSYCLTVNCWRQLLSIYAVNFAKVSPPLLWRCCLKLTFCNINNNKQRRVTLPVGLQRSVHRRQWQLQVDSPVNPEIHFPSSQNHLRC